VIIAVTAEPKKKSKKQLVDEAYDDHMSSERWHD
jgi:hypothetical protein